MPYLRLFQQHRTKSAAVSSTSRLNIATDAGAVLLMDDRDKELFLLMSNSHAPLASCGMRCIIWYLQEDSGLAQCRQGPPAANIENLVVE